MNRRRHKCDWTSERDAKNAMHIQIHIGLSARQNSKNLIKIFHLRTHNLIETCRRFGCFFFLDFFASCSSFDLDCLEWLKAITFYPNWCDKRKSKIFNWTFLFFGRSAAKDLCYFILEFYANESHIFCQRMKQIQCYIRQTATVQIVLNG